MMIKGTVVVYSIPACPHCRTAKATLTQRGLQYVDVDLERFPHLRPWLRETTGKTSVPQIFFNSRHIGGNSELQDLVSWPGRDPGGRRESVGAARHPSEQTELNPSDAGAPRIPKPEEAVTTSAPAAVLPVECEKDELSRLAIDLHDRSNLIMDHRVGLFTKIRDSFSGEAFVNWMIKEKESGEIRCLGLSLV
ncbi:Glutaredoxin 1 [Amphibalanus amphitrite]|uniref:Glutaredoxin 1 n=1 Tax=Amphibalanus amphitrite TaxID=1232801 RepID=A0A6A4W2C2_AMPAM|nr:Glutaredoxin 1 [Amphibalanus amphitrite]